MKPRWKVALGVVGSAGALAAAGGIWLARLPLTESVPLVSRVTAFVESLGAPAGTLTTETNPAARVTIDAAAGAGDAATDWPSYNRTLDSRRFSPLAQIDRADAGRLAVLCTYDTGLHTSFQSGLIMVDGMLIGTTDHDIFALDPQTCRQIWRTHEDYRALIPSRVNRGAAYLDGRLFRGTMDARVLAYDAKTGKRLWATTIGDIHRGETVPAAPIAWNGLVFVGNAGGDFKGGKGRMYALDAATGRVVWEFWLAPKGADATERGPQGKPGPDIAATWHGEHGQPPSGAAVWTSFTLDPKAGLLYVPAGNPAPDFVPELRPGENLFSNSIVVLDARTGAYVRHVKVLRQDWHDWDVSSAPVLAQTRAGRALMALAPKDGHLYGWDLGSYALLYRNPATTIKDADATLSPEASTHFCPGTVGGNEWNGPAYDPRTNLLTVGEVDWCGSIRRQTVAQAAAVRLGWIWYGMAATWNPFNFAGDQDPAYSHWAGRLTAMDADTGVWAWRARSNYPIVGGVTATAGGLVLFGDVGGNFYALDAADGRRLWGEKIGGAIGGGVITYAGADGRQRIAVAAGFESLLWPVEVTTGKVVVLGVR